MSKRKKAKAATSSPLGGSFEVPANSRANQVSEQRWVAKSERSERRPEAETLEEFKNQWAPDCPGRGESVSSADYYFNSYSHFGIHEDMLKDSVRTGSYMKAILENKHIFEGKVVLDVGSGTGILCLFAAKAGAKKCIGIECSEIVDCARAIATQNGYDEVITYVKGKVEEVEIPVDEVDIIISEWMGYFLLYESMLDSVLFARDKWLVPGGKIFPDHANLYLAACEDADYKEEKIGFWSHVWGFDLSVMKGCVMQEPISDIVQDSAIATTSSRLIEIDLHTVKREDLNFTTAFSFKATRKDFLHAFVAWFDVTFRCCSPPVSFSTAPGRPYTHWKQTVLYLDETIVMNRGEVVSGMMAVRKSSANPRDLDLKVSYCSAGKYPLPWHTQFYRLR